jgi:hypothetical protein
MARSYRRPLPRSGLIPKFFHPQIVSDVLDDVLHGRNLLRFVPEALAVVNAIDEDAAALAAVATVTYCAGGTIVSPASTIWPFASLLSR